MKSVNRVTLLGNVGRDPEVRVLTGGNAVAEFSLATSRGGYTGKDGKEVPQKTQWHRIKAFGAITSNIEKYVKKGSTIYVEGRIEYSEYEKNGEKRYDTEIVVDEAYFVDGKQATENAFDGKGEQEPTYTNQKPVTPKFEELATDDDLPF